MYAWCIPSSQDVDITRNFWKSKHCFTWLPPLLSEYGAVFCFFPCTSIVKYRTFSWYSCDIFVIFFDTIMILQRHFPLDSAHFEIFLIFDWYSHLFGLDLLVTSESDVQKYHDIIMILWRYYHDIMVIFLRISIAKW